MQRYTITKRTVEGTATGINWEAVDTFINQGFLPVEESYFNGVSRSFKTTRPSIIIADTLEDFLLAQVPPNRFALALSGGRDSMLLAALYDRKSAEYYHSYGE